MTSNCSVLVKPCRQEQQANAVYTPHLECMIRGAVSPVSLSATTAVAFGVVDSHGLLIFRLEDSHILAFGVGNEVAATSS